MSLDGELMPKKLLTALHAFLARSRMASLMALPAFINPFLMPWMTFQPRLPQSTEVRPSHIALMIWGRAAMIWGMAWMMPTTSLPQGDAGLQDLRQVACDAVDEPADDPGQCGHQLRYRVDNAVDELQEQVHAGFHDPGQHAEDPVDEARDDPGQRGDQLGVWR